jgi:hypothetical protein
MTPSEPTCDDPEEAGLLNELAAMLAAVEQHLEQATGISQAATLLRSLLLILEPGRPVTTWEERLLLPQAIQVLTRRFQTLELLETLREEDA